LILFTLMKNILPEFSTKGYLDVLRCGKDHDYQFILFKDKNKVIEESKYCLIRHDIDISLSCALEMAKLENSQEIVSTYFFMLRSPAYNLLGRYAFYVLNEIKKMGHEIALHFDGVHPAVLQKGLLQSIDHELNILSNLAEQEISSVSFHQPSVEILKGETYIPGKINTYNKEQFRGWNYLSDSNRIWKEHNGISVFADTSIRKIQLLIHPIWWIKDNPVIEDAWDRALEENFYIMQKQFVETERAFGIERKIQLIR
jgi:hypothetical protein